MEYFLHLLYAIYYSVTMHLRPGKKVRYLSPSDVNSEPVPSRRGMLEDSPYREIWTTLSVMQLTITAHLGCGDLGMSCGHLL
jgi:hypothetical protein